MKTYISFKGNLHIACIKYGNNVISDMYKINAVIARERERESAKYLIREE